MHESKLYKSMRVLYDMELERFFVSRCISKLKTHISSFKTNKTSYQKPTMPEEPRKEDCAKNKYLEWSYFFDQPVVRLLIGLFLGALTGLIVCLVRYAIGYQDQIIQTTLLFALCGIGVTMILVPLYMMIDFFIVSVRYPDQEYNLKYDNYKEELRVYNARLNDYNLYNQHEEERIKREAIEKKRILTYIDTLESVLNDTNDCLERYYDELNIFQNYRYIAAIGCMFEFISLGITDKLEGVDGLYYLIMKELKPHQIEITADEILENLEEYCGSQHTVHYEILEKEKESEAMLQNLLSGDEKQLRKFKKYIEHRRNIISEYDKIVAEYNAE